MRRGTSFPLAALCCAALSLTACGGIRDHIRSKDFRDGSPEYRPTGTPSPIANVHDMPGWTTDIDAAIAFATENPQKTVLFVQQNGVPRNEELKKVLISPDAEKALADKQQVTINATTDAEIVARYGIQQAPAVALIGPGGIPESQKSGKISKSELLSYIK